MEVDDGDEMEMTQNELQKWIRQKVEKNELVGPEALKRCQQLQALLERREKQAATFLKLCESVVECEAVTKKLYCLLGWEYRDTDSDEEGVGIPNSVINIDDGDDDVKDCDYMPQSPYEAVKPETEASSSLTTHGRTPPSRRQDSKTQDTDKSKTMQREEVSSSLHLLKDAVVVLTKLPKHKICSALPPPVPQPQYSSDEDMSSYDSDTLWNPKDQSSDSDYANPVSTTKSKKKRGTHQKTGKLRKDDTTKTSTPQAKTDTKTSATNSRTPSQTNINVATGQKPNTEQSCPVVVSTFSQAPNQDATEPPPDIPEEKVNIDMKVLARRRFMNWQQGKIVEIITKGGRLKYKVDLEERARCLVSGHHIAFDHVSIPGQLYIGARVVAKYQEGNHSRFGSGVLGELPSRRNRKRILIFFDDHTFSYVSLSFVHLVCRPLKNALEDIPDVTHRKFIEDYLKVWPYPSLIQYKVGQSIKVEYKGIQKMCKVQRIDSSLVRVVFQDDQHVEWIHRGSIRLEHITSMKKHLDEVDKPDSEPTVTGSTQQTVHTTTSQAGSTSTSKPTTSTSTNTTEQAVISKDHEQVVTIHMYAPHQCCPACLDPVRPKGDMKEHRGQNPLCIPLLYTFRRMKAAKQGGGKVKVFSHVYYRTPCGLCLRSMPTVEDYLYQTQCDFLYLEMFCLDPLVSVTTAYKPLPSKIYILDLVQGKDNQQVSCINEYNNTRPLAVTYTSNRVVTGGISINTSLDFMMGCDCTDGCRDSVFCSCRQLTIQTTALSPGGPGDVSAGYTHKRLNGRITTGVYECNALCQCHPRTCSNRVVQHGIQLRLQVFMTRFKGYGIRCLDDVAKGTFVCAFSEPIKTATPKGKNATDTPAREKAREESTDVIAETTPTTTTRGFFDGKEHCYNIDAMMAGNLARYFNHSCSPNLFEQNVFVDTHNPRFLWLAFFSNKCIKAGTELTWDYRSVIGGAQGVSTGQRCRCGSKNCHGKL